MNNTPLHPADVLAAILIVWFVLGIFLEVVISPSDYSDKIKNPHKKWLFWLLLSCIGVPFIPLCNIVTNTLKRIDNWFTT